MSIAHRQNCPQALLQELGLFSLWSARSALQEGLKHGIRLTLLSLLDVPLNPRTDFFNP
jgi:hypothetical protein